MLKLTTWVKLELGDVPKRKNYPKRGRVMYKMSNLLIAGVAGELCPQVGGSGRGFDEKGKPTWRGGR